MGAAYFLAACFSFEIALGVSGVATVWPASGVFVSALLLARRNQIAAMAIAVAAASIAANVLYGASLGTALAFTTANVVEGLLISQLVIRTSGVPRTLDDQRWLATFFGAAVVGSAASAAIAALLAGELTLPFFVVWFTTVCLGMLIVTPLIVAAANEFPLKLKQVSCGSVLRFALFTGFVGIVCWAALALGEGQFLFLPVIAIAAATYTYGSRGAAISISLIAVIATLETDFSAPVIGEFALQWDTLFLQFYLLSLLCSVWPLSALMAEKAKLIDRYVQSTELLELAEKTARVGHWALEPDNATLIWSEEVFHIHGIDPGEPQLVGAMPLGEAGSLNRYHPEDRDRVRSLLLAAMEDLVPFAYEARIVRPDGVIRYVSSIGRPRYDASGAFRGLFGTFQDITEQTETLEALRVARRDALREAKTALRLSETDELTGIANRRKVFGELRAAARVAKASGTPMTIAVIDIDHFKAVNDRHGHHAGDKVLKRVAQIVSEQLRLGDCVGRIGGEEFLVVLPGEDGAAAHDIVERLRVEVAAEAWDIAGLEQVTMSAGLAAVDEIEGVEKAVQKADRALYEAKQSGRNLLRIAA